MMFQVFRMLHHYTWGGAFFRGHAVVVAADRTKPLHFATILCSQFKHSIVEHIS